MIVKKLFIPTVGALRHLLEGLPINTRVAVHAHEGFELLYDQDNGQLDIVGISADPAAIRKPHPDDLQRTVQYTIMWARDGHLICSNGIFMLSRLGKNQNNTNCLVCCFQIMYEGRPAMFEIPYEDIESMSEISW